jgi:hypothetical protein
MREFQRSKSESKPVSIAGSGNSVSFLRQPSLSIDGPDRRSFSRSWLAGAILGLALIALVIIKTGAPPIEAPWDVFVLLGGAWRISAGQIANVDFANPIGPLVYWLTAFGMRFAGASLLSLVYGNIAFAAMVVPWALVLAFRRLSSPLAFVVTMSVALLVVTPVPLGYAATTTTYAMIYNRYGWALLALLLLHLFVPGRGQSTARTDAVAAGVLLAVLFICKLNFFVVGGALATLAVVIRVDLRTKALLIPAASVILCMPLVFYGILDPKAYLFDFIDAAMAQSPASRFKALMSTLKWCSVPIGLLLICWYALIILPARRGRMAWLQAAKTTLVFWTVLLCALFITIGNTGEGGQVPLLLFSSVLLITAHERDAGWGGGRSSGRNFQTMVGVAWLVLTVQFLWLSGSELRGVYHASMASAYRNVEDARSQRFAATALGDFYIPSSAQWHTAYSSASDVPPRLNEGLQLLRAHLRSNDRIVVLGLTDPFSLLLDRKPARNVPLWWDLNVSFSHRIFPRPEDVFEFADYVIYPHLDGMAGGCCKETVVALLDIYREYLGSRYVVAAESQHWILLRRRTARRGEDGPAATL